MITNKTDFIGEQTSPLFRLMWIHNIHEPARRQFDNNICAFHIGNGLILSVAHNLRMESQVVKTIDDPGFQEEIIPKLDASQAALFNRCYILDPATNKRYLNVTNQPDMQLIMDALKQINYDTRWLTYMKKN